MKSRFALSVVLVLLTGCTIQTGSNTTGRVIISAGTPADHTVSHTDASIISASTTSRQFLIGPKHSRASASRVPRFRSLSAAADFASMSYTLVNSDTGAVVDSKPLDPSYPFVDLILTPGSHYSVAVDAAVTPAAPGAAAGVTRYGDQVSFTVNAVAATYVDLALHPTKTLVLDPASVTGSPAAVHVFDPSDSSSTSWSLFSTSLTVGAADKFFYGPGGLYYFNKAANAVYRWTDIGTKTAQIPMTSADKVIDGTQLGTLLKTGTVQLYAVCADPWDPSSLWFVTYDSVNKVWSYSAVSVGATPSASLLWDYCDISGWFVDDPANDTSVTDLDVTPTGIAVDSTWGDVYVTYYSKSHNTSDVYSALLMFDNDSLAAYYPTMPATRFSGSTSSILTDVAWEQGSLWVLASPNTGLTGTSVTADTGTADIWSFDDLLKTLGSIPTAAYTAFAANLPASLSSSTSRIVLPNRFTGPIQGTTQYFSQADFTDVQGAFGHVLSSRTVGTGTVVSY